MARNQSWRGPALGIALLLMAGLADRWPALGQAAVAAPPLVVEDFESATLGARPFLWKPDPANPAGAVVSVERMALDGNDANKALKLECDFANAAAGAAAGAGPMGQPLPGSLSAVTVLAHGDQSRNAVCLRLRDREGELFEWRAPVTWTGWKKVTYALDPATALRSGAKGNGKLDPPLYLDSVRLARLPGGTPKAAVLVDEITAECAFSKVEVLYDAAAGVKPEAWKANRNRAVAGEIGETTAPRAGKDVPALKLGWQYENSGDSSVEFVDRLPAGEGHGVLVAEIFGDGSNNLLRFRMQDGADHPWNADLPTLLVDWSGWKTVYINTRTLRDPDGAPNAVLSKFPVKFYSLTVDDVSPVDNLPGVESGRKGEIYLGRLLFCSEK